MKNETGGLISERERMVDVDVDSLDEVGDGMHRLQPSSELEHEPNHFKIINYFKK